MKNKKILTFILFISILSTPLSLSAVEKKKSTPKKSSPVVSKEAPNIEPSLTLDDVVKLIDEKFEKQESITEKQEKVLELAFDTLDTSIASIENTSAIFSNQISSVSLYLSALAILISVVGFFIGQHLVNLIVKTKKNIDFIAEQKIKIEKQIHGILNKPLIDEINKKANLILSTESEEELSDELQAELKDLILSIDIGKLMGVDLSIEDILIEIRALSAIKRYKKALERIEEELRNKPSDTVYAKLYFYKGNILLNLSNCTESIKSYNVSLEYSPDNSTVWYNKGLAYSKLLEYSDAIVAYEKAIELRPNDYFAWYNKGCMLSKLKKIEEAKNDFQKSSELKPNDSDSIYNLSCCYAFLNENTKSIDSLQKAIKINSACKEQARTDPDFDTIKDDPEFKKLVGLPIKNKDVDNEE